MKTAWTRTNAFVISPCATIGQPERPGVPENASSASLQMRRAVQTAIASGKRRVCVDALLAALDIRQRTYDEESARKIFLSLISSCVTGGIYVVVDGVSLATRINKWVSASKLGEEHEIVIGLLGSSFGNEIQSRSIRTVIILVNVESGLRSMTASRRLLQAIEKEDKTVILYNHPKEGRLYEMFQYGGVEPIELGDYETVFFMGPLSIEFTRGDRKPARFALMRHFPWKWSLFKFIGDEDELSVGEGGEHMDSGLNGDYRVCMEYGWQPDYEEVRADIDRELPPVEGEY